MSRQYPVSGHLEGELHDRFGADRRSVLFLHYQGDCLQSVFAQSEVNKPIPFVRGHIFPFKHTINLDIIRTGGKGIN